MKETRHGVRVYYEFMSIEFEFHSDRGSPEPNPGPHVDLQCMYSIDTPHPCEMVRLTENMECDDKRRSGTHEPYQLSKGLQGAESFDHLNMSRRHTPSSPQFATHLHQDYQTLQTRTRTFDPDFPGQLLNPRGANSLNSNKCSVGNGYSWCSFWTATESLVALSCR